MSTFGCAQFDNPRPHDVFGGTPQELLTEAGHSTARDKPSRPTGKRLDPAL